MAVEEYPDDWPRAACAEIDQLEEKVESLKGLLADCRSFICARDTEQKFDHCGAMNATQLSWRDHYRTLRRKLEQEVVQCPECGGMGHPAAECDNMG